MQEWRVLASESNRMRILMLSLRGGVSWHGIVSAPFSHVLSEYAARVDAIVRPVSELG